MNDSSHIAYRVLDSLLRHRWLFILSFLGVSGTALLALSTRPQTYRATANTRVLTDDTATLIGVTQSAVNYGTSLAQQNVNRFEDLTNDDLPGGFLDTVVKQAKPDRPIVIDRKANDPRYRQLRKGITATTASDTMFAVNLTWDSPNEAQRIVQALQIQYIEQVGLGQQAKSVATEKFLDSQIADYERRLRQADQALIDFKQKNSGQSPEAQDRLDQQLAVLKAELEKLQITAQDNALKRQALEHRLAQIEPMIQEQTEQTPAGQGSQWPGDPSPSRLLRELQLKKDQLLALYTPESLEIKQIDAQMTTLKEEIAAAKAAQPAASNRVLEIKRRANPEYRTLMLQITETNIAEKTQASQRELLQRRIAEHEARLAQMPAAQRELAEKTRDYTVLKDQYEKMLERREQAQTQAALAKAAARSTLAPIGTVVVEPSTSKMKLALLLVGGLMAGLMFGAGMVVVKEWTDPSVRYAWDVEKLLGLPVLASLPDAAQRPLALGAGTGGSEEAERLSDADAEAWIPDLSGPLQDPDR